MQENQNNYHEHPIKFYSKLVEWLERCQLQSATGAQWAGTLRNLKGIRREELELALPMYDLAHGLSDEKIDSHVLLDMTREVLAKCYPTLLTQRTYSFTPGVKFRRVVPEVVPKKVLQKHSFSNVLRCYQHISLGYRLMEVGYHDLLSIPSHWLVFDDKWNLYLRNNNERAFYTNPLKAIDDIYEIILRRFGGYQSQASLNQYEEYSLKGGAKYREWLVCLNAWSDQPYEYGHFDKQNVLVHLRTSEWVDVEGEPLLLVDEVQSDWNAHYRYLQSLEDDTELLFSAPPFANKWYELGIKVACIIAAKAGLRKIAFTTGELQCQRYNTPSEGLLNLYDRLIPKALEKLEKMHNNKLKWSKLEFKQPKFRVTNRNLNGWGIMQSNKLVIKNIRHKKVAMAFIEAKSEKNFADVRVFDMTPSFISEIEVRGMSLFGW